MAIRWWEQDLRMGSSVNCNDIETRVLIEHLVDSLKAKGCVGTLGVITLVLVAYPYYSVRATISA